MLIQEALIKTIDALKDVPIFDEDDPRTEPIATQAIATWIAEAGDTTRLYDLLHRDEYRPLAIVRHHGELGGFLCVYFERTCDTIRAEHELANDR